MTLYGLGLALWLRLGSPDWHDVAARLYNVTAAVRTVTLSALRCIAEDMQSETFVAAAGSARNEAFFS
jgi:hypothetical protein